VDPRYSLAGLVVGTFVGLTGVGGSALLAPLLILLLSVKPSIAVGTDLIYSVPTKLLALGLHQRQRTVDWTLTLLLLAGGLPGALLGLFALWQLHAHVDDKTLQATIRHGIGLAIVLASLGSAALWFARRRARVAAEDPHGTLTRARRIGLVAGGFFIGALIAITSVGGGSVTLPFLVLALPAFSLKRLIGSEVAFAALLIPLAAFGHIGLGNVSWTIAGSLIVGSLPGVWLGTLLLARFGDAWLKPVVIGTLAFAGSRLL
jgi:uncharacterized membrane protein YfcA